MIRLSVHGLSVVLLAAATAACGTALLAVDPPGLGEAFELQPGQSTAVEGTPLLVKFVEVPTDSRCPVDVTCVWEGDAAVVLETVLDGAEETVSLHTAGDPDRDGARYVDIGPYRVHLVDLLPEPESERSIPAFAYRTTLRVTSGA
jgi:hypothetical protein